MSEETGLPENRITIRAEGQTKVNAVGSIHNAKSVHVGNRYENQCQLPPPVVENISYIPDDRDLETWIDREQVQAELLQRVEAAQTVLVEIVASSGFGKSSLAVWVCEQTDRQRRKKAIWVSFAKASRFNAFARWVLYELCVPTEDRMTEDFLTEQLVFHLRQQPRLVVMDQLEAIAKAEEQQFFRAFLARWQQKGKGSTVLVTTQLPFGAQESTCLRLSGFIPTEGGQLFTKAWRYYNASGRVTKAIGNL